MRKLLLASAATLVASAGVAFAQPAKAPAPGTIVVNLHGAFEYEFGVTSTGENSASTKQGSFNNVGYIRLYPGFDAMTTTGLQYGVASEFRDSTANVGPGSGNNVDGTNTTSNASNLYVRRAYGYIGSAQTGFVRFGQGDPAFTLLQNGVIEGFGDGQEWNSDQGIGNIIPGGTPGQFIYADTSRLYTTQHIVYLSPALGGFSFGISFEPNSNGFEQGLTGDASNQISIAQTAAGTLEARRRNTIDGMIQWVGEFAGLGIKASGGEMIGSPLGNTLSPAQSAALGVPNYAKRLEVTQGGVSVSYGGLTVGGNVKYGQVNNSYTMLVPGQRKGFDYIVGATYTMGPVVFGGSYFHNLSAGSHTAFTPTVGQTYNSEGAAAGVTYTMTPNLITYVTYLYGQEHQKGVSSIGPAGNAHQQALAVGATLKW